MNIWFLCFQKWPRFRVPKTAPDLASDLPTRIVQVNTPSPRESKHARDGAEAARAVIFSVELSTLPFHIYGARVGIMYVRGKHSASRTRGLRAVSMATTNPQQPACVIGVTAGVLGGWRGRSWTLPHIWKGESAHLTRYVA